MNSKLRFMAALVAASQVAAPLSGYAGQVTVNSDITTSQRWTKDNVYVLGKVVYVKNDSTLTIEPGTVVRGVRSGTAGINISGSANQPGALVITRGSKLVANGTPEEPIYFTSIDDPYVPLGNVSASAGGNKVDSFVNLTGSTITVTHQNYSVDGPGDDPTTSANEASNVFMREGEWGGVILLGRGKVGINDTTTSGTVVPLSQLDGTGTTAPPLAQDPTSLSPFNGTGATLIEGLAFTTDGIFGGDDKNDNSGVMRFCTHRFGGFIIGTNNEINGVTLGGVGRQTVVEWQEIYNNQDDTIEPFGGSVDLRWIFGLYNGDDGLDYDNGYDGRSQFIFEIKNNRMLRDPAFGTFAQSQTGRIPANDGDHGMELDGPEPSPAAGGGDSHRPVTNAQTWNVSLILGGPLTTMGFSGTTPYNTGNGVSFAINPKDAVGDNPAASQTIEEDLDAEVANIVIERTNAPTFLISGVQGNNFPFRVNQIVANLNSGTTTVNPAHTGLLTANVINNGTGGVSQFVGIGRTFVTSGTFTNVPQLVKNGLDMRLTGTAAARTVSGTAPDDGFFAPVNFAGAAKDNNLLAGWSLMNDIQINTTAPNVTRPLVTLSRSGSNTIVFTFNTVNGVQYLLETSSDGGKTYAPIAPKVITAAVTGTTTVATPAPLTVGTPVYARVTPL